MEQGSYTLNMVTLPLAVGSGEVEFTHGFAVLTQTCDIVRPRERLTLVALVPLTSPEQANWGGGKSPQYFQVHADFFADFEQIAVVDKSRVLALPTQDLSPLEARGFRQAAARKFGRAPVPDHVDEVLRHLRDWFKKRSSKATYSATIERIREIRIQVSPDWENDSDKDDVELTFLFEPGDLAPPEQDEVSAGVEEEIATSRTGNPADAIQKLALLLHESIPGTGDDAALWEAISDQFARLLEQKAHDYAALNSDAPKIGAFIVTSRTKDDMTVAEFERTERVDLEHLSSDEIAG